MRDPLTIPEDRTNKVFATAMTQKTQVSKFQNVRNDTALRREFKELIDGAGSPGSTLVPIYVPGVNGDAVGMYKDTSTGNIFDPFTYSVYPDVSKAKAEANAKVEANKQFAPEPRTPDQGIGFRTTILTGGQGLAGTLPATMRRAGSLLTGLDRENEFILS
jgi:hypothetical protein